LAAGKETPSLPRAASQHEILTWTRSAANYMGYFRYLFKQPLRISNRLLTWNRPTVGSLDQWADIVGDPAWSWDNIYPFFKRSCNFTPPNFEKIDPSINITYDEDSFIREAGPLQVSYGNYQYTYATPLAQGLETLGFPFLPGLNSGRQIGYASSTAAIDTRTATRSSSETSFLQSAAMNTSIKIYPHTLAKQILFDNNKRAAGVLVQATSLHNFTWTISANNEVIVSSGTVSEQAITCIIPS
jgi:choline dehydrogenase